MHILTKVSRPAKFFDILLKDGTTKKVIGNYARATDDGSLVVFTDDDEVVAAYVSGHWQSLTSTLVPMMTVNTDTGETWDEASPEPPWHKLHRAPIGQVETVLPNAPPIRS